MQRRFLLILAAGVVAALIVSGIAPHDLSRPHDRQLKDLTASRAVDLLSPD